MLYRSQQPKTAAITPATNTSEAKAEEKAEETSEPLLGIANPASEYCVAQ